MINEIFDRLSSVLEQRFLKNALLPVVLFVPTALLPTLLQDGRLGAVLRTWDGLAGSAQVLLVLSFMAGCWFAASLVASQWRNIIRLYEGYPLEHWPQLSEMGKRWHKDQRRRLDAASTDQAAGYLTYWAYPAVPDVLPTRLGNIMRAGEAYPLYRYQAETILLWPRLTHVLPRDLINDITQARASLEFLLVVSLWCGGFAVVNPLSALLAGSSPVVAALCFALGLCGAYLAYTSALPGAFEYALYLSSTFEMYRFDLLARLRIPPPADLAEERERWSELCRFILGGLAPSWMYEHGVFATPPMIDGVESPDGSGV